MRPHRGPVVAPVVTAVPAVPVGVAVTVVPVVAAPTAAARPVMAAPVVVVVRPGCPVMVVRGLRVTPRALMVVPAAAGAAAPAVPVAAVVVPAVPVVAPVLAGPVVGPRWAVTVAVAVPVMTRLRIPRRPRAPTAVTVGPVARPGYAVTVGPAGPVVGAPMVWPAATGPVRVLRVVQAHRVVLVVTAVPVGLGARSPVPVVPVVSVVPVVPAAAAVTGFPARMVRAREPVVRPVGTPGLVAPVGVAVTAVPVVAAPVVAAPLVTVVPAVTVVGPGSPVMAVPALLVMG